MAVQLVRGLLSTALALACVIGFVGCGETFAAIAVEAVSIQDGQNLNDGVFQIEQLELVEQAADQAPRPPLQIRPLTIGEPMTVNLKSRGIEWNGYTYHLVTIPKIEFTLSNDKRLTATSSVTLVTFDNAPYRAHVAVYDETGQLLGTAAADCETQRVWLGKVLTTWRELTFDFGQSNAFEQAAFFSISVSDHDLQTPDDWQK